MMGKKPLCLPFKIPSPTLTPTLQSEPLGGGFCQGSNAVRVAQGESAAGRSTVFRPGSSRAASALPLCSCATLGMLFNLSGPQLAIIVFILM